MKKVLILLMLFFLTLSQIISQENAVPFDSARWDMKDASITDHLGRQSLAGIAMLKDTEFTNGVIEFDLAVNGERSYPGVIFRVKNDNEYERIYIRPHLSKTFQNVLQYEGTFNGLDSWQLYYGPGKTASAIFPFNEWFHVKIEVMDTQARLYISNMEKPALTITDLAHGISTGTLGLWGPMDGSAYFSNFRYVTDNNIMFPEPPKPDDPLGIITDWEISQPLKLSDYDMEALPDKDKMKDFLWQKVKSLPSGMVDISRYYARLGQSPDIIWARTEIISDRDQNQQFAFGYSDYISIFLNGRLLFAGNSQYQSRDANFQGIIGFNDYIFLPLKKGKNELLIAVAESFGGWGFMFQDVNEVFEKPGLKKQWEIRNTLKYPESAVYDSKRDVLYISNLTYENGGFVSKIRMDGTIDSLEFITGVLQPTGLAIRNDRLYIVGRYALVEYDLEKNAVTNRFRFPGAIFPNDVAFDEKGNFYVTDGAKRAIFRLENGKFSEWLNGEILQGVNGICAMEGKIYVGTSGDGSLKSIDISTKEVKTLFSFGKSTVIDGLTDDGSGNFLISDHAGRLFRITPDGRSEMLLNTKSRQITLADFEFVRGRKLIAIPTLSDNRVMVYEMK